MSLALRMSNSSSHLCGASEAGKMTKAKHPSKTIMTTTRPFELLHMDLFGPNHYSAVQMMHLYMALLLLMITLDTHGYTLLLTNMKCRKSSNDFPRGLQPTLVRRSSTSEVTMELSSRILVLMTILMNLVLLMSYLFLILLNRMASWSART